MGWMSEPSRFVAPGRDEIRAALGAEVFHVLSDAPWSFSVPTEDGSTVTVWVEELPDTVVVTVRVVANGEEAFSSRRPGATRLAVSASEPQIVVESEGGRTRSRLSISLGSRVAIEESSVDIDD